MLSIHNNMLAMNADHFFKINSKANKRSTEKLSSGYRINRAADDAAGLGISEKMRRQIRGLMQGTVNAQEGISFVQVADGSMDEVHGMLQRMNELALKSLNGTCTQGDRAALNAEFNQLRTEIDRINRETEFNEQPVFEEHENSYYQISGNRKWNEEQLHTITPWENELSIHLPDSYEPKDYTLTVPAGTYSTRELIDEIDSTLERMQPPNPGFVFEYTDTGICKLNFENADGMPTEITSVDGSLSYLLFDGYNGGSSSSLLGTTVFSADFPLTIKRGENDQLGFYVESAKYSNYISLTIPQGDYKRSDIIKTLNELLSQNPDAAGIVAKEYGDSCVQITGGSSVSIIGLKGNMFKLDPKYADIKYSSVFYDNMQYGSSSSSAASITGSAYYDTSNKITDKIYLSSANQNNVLRFKVNGADDYTEITFQDKAGGYTMAEIRDEINRQIEEKGLTDAVRAGTSSSLVDVQSSPTGTSRVSMQCLTLSSLVSGGASSLEFDVTDGSAALNTYNALFRDTNYFTYQVAGYNAEYRGSANLNGEVKLSADASLTFKINDTQDYTISGIGGTHANGQDLVDKLNDIIATDSAYDAIKDKIQFELKGSNLTISALDGNIQKISFDSTAQASAAYKTLFVGSSSSITGLTCSSPTAGEVTQKEGSTEKSATPATASATFSTTKDLNKIKIEEGANQFTFSSSDGTKTVTLAAGTYTMAGIVSQINAQLKPSDNSCFSSITCSYENNKLTLTAMPKATNTAGRYTIQFNSSSSAWNAICDKVTYEVSASSREAMKNTTGTRTAIAEQTTVDGSNNALTLKVGSDSATINIGAGTYNDRDSLKNAIQAAIDNDNTLKGKVAVSITSDNRLEFTSSAGSITASGSFYDKVLITQKQLGSVRETVKGQHNAFQPAYIIGRKDLTEEPVEIISGGNDMFTFDFTHKDYRGNENKTEINIKIPEGTYTGDEIAALLQEKIQEKFEEEGIEDFEVAVTVGGEKTDVVGAIDDVALQIKVKEKAGRESANGQYVVDGVRGSAAGYLFYKTTINPKATYITGSKNLSKGVTFKPGQNVFTFSADDIPYKYTFETNKHYSAEELASFLNDKFENGDDNGNVAPLVASIENGCLKIAHKALGAHTITDIGGSARSTLFLEEDTRNFREPIYLLVGAETKDLFEIPRTRVNSCSLAINSITISRPKYAEKAVSRIKEAITMVSSRRSTYGSIQNRLEHTINNNNNVIENTQASESAIRDTDIASESMEYAMNRFLMQSSQTILAQANQQANLVLNLLQA